jgi:hypothetical protein
VRLAATAAVAALAGAGLGLFAAALAAALASFFWPLIAGALVRGALVAGGCAALAAALAPPSWRERLCRRLPLLALAGLAAAAAAVAATGALAQRLNPGPGLGLLSFPAPYLAALALPFAAAGIAVVGWCGRREGRVPAGLFVAGVGAGALAAALIATVPRALPPPWDGQPLLEFSAAGLGIREVSIDRGLRKFLVAPRGADLAFPLAASKKRRDVLVVGLANGPVLSTLLKHADTRTTILEEDAALVRGLVSRWPALAKASAAGRVKIVGGDERWALLRLRGRFDLIVLGESWSAAAYHSRALSHRRDHRWTTQAFAAYLSRLKPRGRLLAQRTSIGRVAATLREAAGLPAAEFARRVVVLGRGGRIVSELWYSPAGFDTRQAQAALRRHRSLTGIPLLYNPADARGRNFYTPLIRGERPRGLAFSTPLDLSPAIDERPFFDSAERLMLSPRGRTLPEELEPLEGPARLRILPAADRALWGILFAGLAAVAAALALHARAVRRAAAQEVAVSIPAAALWHGAAAGVLLEAFAAWAGWLAPLPAPAAAAWASLLAGIGAGWAGAPRAGARVPAWAPAAVLTLLFAAAGYRVLPAAVRLGPAAVSAAMIAAAALLGVLLGRALGADRPGVAADPGTNAARCGASLAAAPLGALAASLAAPHFGYPLLWVLGAVALLAPSLRLAPEHSRAPAGAGPSGAAT